MPFFADRSDGFWHVPPVRSSDPAILRQAGIQAVTAGNGEHMMAIGWRIWDVAGINSEQAFDFLADGYRAWQGMPSYTPLVGASFLAEMVGRLAANPDTPPDLYAVPPAVVEPIATHYAARCWAAAEMWSLHHANTIVADEERLYAAIASSPRPFVPPRSMALARDYAQGRGWPDPFS